MDYGGSGHSARGFLRVKLYKLQKQVEVHTTQYNSKARFTILCRIATSRPAAKIIKDSILVTRQRGKAQQGNATYCQPSTIKQCMYKLRVNFLEIKIPSKSNNVTSTIASGSFMLSNILNTTLKRSPHQEGWKRWP